MKFNYTARTKEGQVKTGDIEASSRQEAAKLLHRYDIFVTSLKEEFIAPSLFTRLTLQKKISKKELAVFSRQLAMMLESRVPIIQCLSSLSIQHPNPRFKKTLTDITALVQEGKSLSEAIANHPDVFSGFYANLLKSGEASGNISTSLYFLADSLERDYDITAQINQAMIYPFMVLCVLSAVIIVIIVALVPRIEELVMASNVEPSLVTVAILSFYRFLSFSWWIFLLATVLAVLSLSYYGNTDAGKRRYDTLALKIPYLRDILKKVYLVIFCGNVATLVSAGVSITRSLEITEHTVNNRVYQDIIAKVRVKVNEGEKISAALSVHQEYFPPFVVQMIRVGEDTGKLEKTLLEIVSFYRKEIQRAITAFSTLLEPVLIIFLGAIVTAVAISVLSPLYGILGSF